MGISIFKKIKLANKVIDTYKEVKEIVKENKPLSKDVEKVLNNLKADFDALLALLPQLGNVYEKIKEALK
jgi:hypothetical protein